MGFFTRLIAGLVAASTLGAGLAGTAGAVDTTGATGDAKGVVKLASDDTSGLPDHLVNGDFSVNYKDQWLTGGWNWTSITPDGKYLNSVRNWNDSATIWKTVNGWDKTKFGWSSTQKDDTDNIQHKAGAVEIQYDSQADNVYAELCAYEKGTAIYQDIKTVPGTLYKIRLKHASLYSGYLDKMQVMVGAPGHEQAVEMTRTSVNGNGDTLNEKSTTIATKVSNTGELDRNHENQWETYEGTYVIPDGQTTTRFTFRSVAAESMDRGNLLDDIVFDKAYRLNYDKNASDASGQVPSNERGRENTVQPAKAKTTGSVKTVADDDSSKSLTVNPGFDVPDYSKLDDGGLHWMYVSPAEGKAWSYYDYINPAQPKHQVAGLSQATFGWQELTGGDYKTTLFELHREKDGNVCADVHGSRTIGQTIDTQAGVAYTVSIRHSGRSKGNAGSVQVLVGPDKNHLRPLEMSRMNVSRTGAKYGDRTGKVGTVITTHSDSVDSTEGNHPAWDHSDDWETYSGTYVATGGKTVFAYRGVDKNGNAVSGTDSAADSVIDDLSFKLAYPLVYDKNAGDATGGVPSSQYGRENTVKPAKAKTNGTVKTVVDTSDGLPTELVNGDFEYPGADVLSQNLRDKKRNWWGVSRKDKMVYESDNPTKWVSLPSTFDSDRFAWDSTEAGKTSGVQEGSSQWHTNEVELQRDSRTGNMYAELSPYQAQSSIRQYIRTTPGALYKVRLKHASLSSEYLDKMQVLIGADGNEQPVRMTRVESQNGLDATGKATASTTISTHASNKAEISWGSGLGYHSSRNHDGQWATYEGVYVATSDVTVFTFKSVDSPSFNTGNLLDDVVFTKAYKLTYDKNSADASGQVPSNQRGKENTTQPAKTKTTGSVRLAADKTASGLTVHDLEMNDVPADYRQFILSTTDTRLSQVEFEDGAWYKSTDPSSQGMWPLRIGSSLTIPSVGDWTDPSGKTHQISMTMRLKDWNGGSVSELYRFDGHGNIVGDGRFWINTAYGSGYSSLPAKVKAAMGGVDTSKRVGCSWTVEFTYADTGEKVPDTFKGVTGFNDLDGWDAQSDLKFEGVQLLSGFDGAYKRSDAELGTYGTNGFAGIGHDAGDEAHLNAPQQSRHRLAATWTGSTFTFSYDLSNPAGRTDGSRMTFGAPVTRTAVLTYDKNAADASGQVPSNMTPDTTQTASSKSTGKVSDLVQRTTTHEDGSVTVRTVDQSTDVVSGCQVYYPAGQRITLATLAKDGDCWDSSMLTRPGHTQLGWNQDSQATQAQAEVTMVEGGMTVYAVWVGNPVLTYDTNKPNTWNGQMPSTPASVSVAYNTAAADGSGWQSGDTSKIRGYRFLGWYAGPQDDAGLYDWNTLLTGNVTVYAHWQRLQANVVYDANGGTGSHVNTPGWQYTDATVPSDTSKSFKRDGYVFLGWDTQADGNGTAYKDGSQVPLQDKDITLYAQWQPVFEQFTPTGGVSLPLLVAGGVTLLVMGIGSTVMLTRRMRGEQ